MRLFTIALNLEKFLVPIAWQLGIANTNTGNCCKSLFKSIHVSREMPYVKYNPGLRRENIKEKKKEGKINN